MTDTPTTVAYVVDTETHAIDNPIPVELSYAPFYPKPKPHWTVPVTQRFNPGKPIALGAMATHLIDDADVADKPLWAGPWVPPEGTRFIIGHNVDFDHEALGKPDVKKICTLALSRAEWPELDSHKLVAVCLHIVDRRKAIDYARQAHSAKHDVNMCAHIMCVLFDRHPEWKNWNDVYAASNEARIPKVMGFGKHKGVPIEKVPNDYIDWYKKQTDVDPWYLVAFARVELERA